MGFSNIKIAKQLKISRDLVIDYLCMTPEVFTDFITSLQNWTKKLDDYQHEILAWLRAYPYATSTQI